jgi:hypothetical protein
MEPIKVKKIEHFFARTQNYMHHMIDVDLARRAMEILVIPKLYPIYRILICRERIIIDDGKTEA